MDFEIFDSISQSAGHLGAFFEADDEAAYFYLYDNSRDEGEKIIRALLIFDGKISTKQKDVEVILSNNEELAGLMIKNQLWAVFELKNRIAHGGYYVEGAPSPIANEFSIEFKRS
jgi:hypothetical protein